MLALPALSVALATAGCGSSQDPPPRFDKVNEGEASAAICQGAPPFERVEAPASRIGSSPFHTCALLHGGRVACWGDSYAREVGDGTWETRPLPTFVPGISDAVDLSVYEYGTCVARSTGAVLCWGNPWGPSPTEVAGLTGVVRLSAWRGTACGVRRDGGVTCAGTVDGDSDDRVIADPYDLPGIRDAIGVAVGAAGVCVLHACGRVSCGRRYWTRPGNVPNQYVLQSLRPVGGVDDARALVMASYVNTSAYERACVLRASGRVACFPQSGGVAETPEALEGAGGFVGIGGGQGICAFERGGSTKCFGPTMVVRKKPEDPETPDEVSVPGIAGVGSGGAFRCAALGGDRLACWGRELGGVTNELHVPMPVGDLADAVQITAGRLHTCAARKNGDLACFGAFQSVTMAGEDGGGGASYLTGQGISGLHFMAEVLAGDGFSCARTRAGEVFCWGRDDQGQLGDGAHREDRQLPTPVEGIVDATSLAVGPAYACLIRRSGEVQCWGAHPLSAALGGGLGRAVIPELAGVVEIAAGDHHACGRTSTGRILCVGAAPRFDRDGSPDIVQIVAGAAHTCVLLKTGRVACAGVPDPTPRELPLPAAHLAAGGPETCAVLSSGQVSCWGGAGWSAPWHLVHGARKVATSGKHACVLLESGGVSCWGASRSGALGKGPSDVRYPPTEIPVPDTR